MNAVRLCLDRVSRSALGLCSLLALFTLMGGGAEHAQAHELRPGYLELQEIEPGTWGVVFKVPTKGEVRLDLRVRLPDRCESTEPVTRMLGTAHVLRWRAICSPELVGQAISIEGLAGTETDVIARVKQIDGTTQTVRLTADNPRFEVERAPSQLEVAGVYLELGVEHILTGFDHLLFVLAMLFLVGSSRRLVTAITAFTAAHSLTLAAATLGWIYVPSAPVEAAIALSIVFVAAEVLRDSDSGALARRKPWLLAFAFGLLHGLGFAGALSNVGLPSHAIPVALAFFNIGVEVGQLMFIAAVLCAFKLASTVLRKRLTAGKQGLWTVAEALAVPASYSIGILGAFWLIQRTASFWDPR